MAAGPQGWVTPLRRCPPCRLPAAEALSRNRPSQDPVFRQAACSGDAQGSFFPCRRQLAVCSKFAVL